jgi:alpha-glucosidase
MMARKGEDQLGHKIGRGIRRAVKIEFPHAYILGEHFHDGTPHLQGNELDASMNYRGFCFPLLQWLAGFDVSKTFGFEWSDENLLPTDALATQWREFMAAIPWQIAAQQFNLLGSHDTPRILNLVDGNRDRARLAATLLFTFPGVPCIYYGEEIGLTGGRDPDNRRCMPWDREQWDLELLNHYQKLIRLRRRSSALQNGGFQLLHARDETISFLRESLDQRLIVIARRSEDSLLSLPVRHGGFADGARLRELFTDTESIVTNGQLPLIGIHPLGTQIWEEI